MEHLGLGTAEDVFTDFKGRRDGLIQALTNDVEELYRQCDCEELSLYLYGHHDGTWEVKRPVKKVPTVLPEPAVGINFVRDKMLREDWLYFVAKHSDSWLLFVAFYCGGRLGFGKNERNELFRKINELPTILETLTANADQPKELSVANKSNSKYSSKTTMSEPQPKSVENNVSPDDEDDSGEEREEEYEIVEEKEEAGHSGEKRGRGEEELMLCKTCGKNYGTIQFWICCSDCKLWFHGECVNVTEYKAKHMKHYKCPICCDKRDRVLKKLG